MLAKGKVTRVILVVAIVGVLCFPAIYLWIANSEPYAVAEQYVRSSKAVSEVFGQVRKTRLSFQGFSVSYGDAGHASLQIVVDGEKKEGLVEVRLIQRLGAWQLAGASARTEESNEIRELTDFGSTVTK